MVTSHLVTTSMKSNAQPLKFHTGSRKSVSNVLNVPLHAHTQLFVHMYWTPRLNKPRRPQKASSLLTTLVKLKYSDQSQKTLNSPSKFPRLIAVVVVSALKLVQSKPLKWRTYQKNWRTKNCSNSPEPTWLILKVKPTLTAAAATWRSSCSETTMLNLLAHAQVAQNPL